mmetsp:Transcript_28138/g.43901  ORF Transcript_28138/g.43901 Transcript_28138/m.43901 type:complete len:340 (-) Transcript_28138:393-1412(-)
MPTKKLSFFQAIHGLSLPTWVIEKGEAIHRGTGTSNYSDQVIAFLDTKDYGSNLVSALCGRYLEGRRLHKISLLSKLYETLLGFEQTFECDFLKYDTAIQAVSADIARAGKQPTFEEMIAGLMLVQFIKQPPGSVWNSLVRNIEVQIRTSGTDANSLPLNTIREIAKATAMHQQIGRAGEDEISVNNVHYRGSARFGPQKCDYCGTSHPKNRTKCPAQDYECDYCGKHHFLHVCNIMKRDLDNGVWKPRLEWMKMLTIKGADSINAHQVTVDASTTPINAQKLAIEAHQLNFGDDPIDTGTVSRQEFHTMEFELALMRNELDRVKLAYAESTSKLRKDK